MYKQCIRYIRTIVRKSNSSNEYKYQYLRFNLNENFKNNVPLSSKDLMYERKTTNHITSSMIKQISIRVIVSPFIVIILHEKENNISRQSTMSQSRLFSELA